MSDIITQVQKGHNSNSDDSNDVTLIDFGAKNKGSVNISYFFNSFFFKSIDKLSIDILNSYLIFKNSYLFNIYIITRKKEIMVLLVFI